MGTPGMDCLSTFWRQFKILTWKNQILRRRNLRTWLIEIFIPVVLTLGMLGIYNTIKPKVVEQYTPDTSAVTSFSDFYASFGTPMCMNMDSNAFWRCNPNACDPTKCERLTFAIAPSSASDAGSVAAATALQTYVNTATNHSTPTKLFTSASDLDAHIHQPGYHLNAVIARIGVAVVFESGTPDYKYQLRFNRTINQGFQYFLPPTKLVTDSLLRSPYDWPKACDRCWETYLNMWFNTGALAVQNLVDSFIVSRDANMVVDLKSAVINFPSPSYKEAGFWGSVSAFYGIFMVIAILFPVSNVVRNLVVEKELRIREGMRMMSLTDSALYASWAVHFGTTFTIIAALIVLVAGKLFEYSDKGLIFLYYLLFFYSTIAFSFFMSTFFSRSKTAAILGVLPYFAGYFIVLALKTTSGRSSYLAAMLHPSAAFTLGTNAFTEYEDSAIGVTKYSYKTSESKPYTFADTLGMMCLDIVLYTVLAWYNDKVWPSEFGTRLSPYFFLTRQYWKSVFPRLFGAKEAHVVTDVEGALAAELTPDVERVPENLAQQIRDGKCVYIRGLYKEFETNTGLKKAVDGLNLTMYSGQITALLGHNGAGKSTTIGMLTGLIEPTRGVAMIAGKDITHDMQEIRHTLGVCPQHDVLFADLTVEEHLTLFASFRGVPRAELKGAVENMIQEVGLTEKRKVPSKNLSGGMKRKLSVGIAFIGDPKVVFLDEPTSGMDPYSRRFTWNVIRKYREGRVVIFSTHFMDEADILGDRIAIMGKGKLQACGSSLFLKNHFGVGYNMVIERAHHGDPRRIERFVRERVPEATVLSNVGAEISFQLPMSASPSFTPLFEDLDRLSTDMGIVTYGMSVTTLEEVFLRVARGEEVDVAERTAVLERRKSLDQLIEKRASNDGIIDRRVSHEVIGRRLSKGKSLGASMGKEMDKAEAVAAAGPTGEIEIDYNNGWLFFRRHMYALFVKRMLYFSRDKKAWFYQFGMPALFVLLGVILMRFGNNSIFATPMIPFSLSNTVYNHRVATHPNPLYYNTDGHFFLQNMLSTPYGGMWSSTNSSTVSGQSSIMSLVTDSASLPTVPYVALNAKDMSFELLLTNRDWRASRYGAVTFANVSRVSASRQTFSWNVHANYSGVHSSAVFSNLVSDAILRLYTPTGSITTVINPLPVTGNEKSTGASFDGFPVVIMIMLAFSFIPAAFALFVVRERETKAKHIQIVSGVSFLSYWLSTWIFDFLSFQIPMWLTIIILKAFNVKALMGKDTVGVVILLLELWGASVTGFTYLTSFVFEKHSQAQVGAILLNFVFGLILVIVTMIMSFIDTTSDVAKKLSFLFRLVPGFALGNGLLNTVFKDFFGSLDGKKYTVWSTDIAGGSMIYMGVEAVAFFLLTLLVEFLIRRPYFSNFLLWLKSGGQPNSILPFVPPELKDDDVIKEEERVANAGAKDDVVIIKDMKKVYPGGKAAVRGLSLGIPNGECFGLLGVNGAGKTTTLSILTAEFPPSSGDVMLGGFSIQENPDVVRRLVGYCPQFDALFDLLTGREHLELYARVKGLREDQVKQVVDKKIKEMDLTEYGGRQASTYSGGNKRKLSVAMAMIGRPLIVFLDEPSTGMDPVARRFMWQVISDITTKRGECCLILTTHSMEECEALCTRIGIMVGGRLRCLGSSTRLKNRFGAGFQVELSVTLPSTDDITAAASLLVSIARDGKITKANLNAALGALGHAEWTERISASGSGADVWQAINGNAGAIGARELAAWCKLEERVDGVQTFIESQWHASLLRERQGAKVRYEIPSRDESGEPRRIAQLFKGLESVRAPLYIEEYSVSQTSLEQVFNFFASQQEEEQGEAVGIIKPVNKEVAPTNSPAPARVVASPDVHVGVPHPNTANLS